LTNLTASSVSFCWVDGGDGRQVQYTATIGGQPYSANATFNVKRPTAQVTSTTGTVAVSSAWGYLALHYGTSATPGITFSRSITIPSGFSGTTQWVQLVSSTLRRRKLNNGVWQRLQGTGVLDTTYPYSANSSTVDSPDTPLTSDYVEKTVQDSFKMWLMFMPSGSGSIWVPLRSVNWSWSGSASRSGTVWTLTSSSNTINPSDADSTTHPTWTSNVTSLQWVNE